MDWWPPLAVGGRNLEVLTLACTAGAPWPFDAICLVLFVHVCWIERRISSSFVPILRMPWRLTLSSLAHAHVTVTRSNVEIHPSWARSVGCLSRATGNAASTLVPASYCSWPSQSWDSSEVQHSTRTWTLDISIYILICYLKTNKDVKGC